MGFGTKRGSANPTTKEQLEQQQEKTKHLKEQLKQQQEAMKENEAENAYQREQIEELELDIKEKKRILQSSRTKLKWVNAALYARCLV